MFKFDVILVKVGWFMIKINIWWFLVLVLMVEKKGKGKRWEIVS